MKQIQEQLWYALKPALELQLEPRIYIDVDIHVDVGLSYPERNTWAVLHNELVEAIHENLQ